MRIAFVSTMNGYRWGGSEELWAAAAREALQLGHEVCFSTLYWARDVPAVLDLISRGAVWLPRGVPAPPPPPPPPPRRFAWLRRPEPPPEPATVQPSDFQQVVDAQPDVICISQGATFDFLSHEDLCALIYESGRPYVVLCRFNTDELSVEADCRERAVTFLQRASHVGFAADRNRKAAERQIAAVLRHASVVQSPVRFQDFTSLPWPEGDRAVFASVARLHAATKGHDLLFECLSDGRWRSRDWQLFIYGDGPDRERYDRLLDFYGLASRVTLAGHVHDIVRVWRNSHILILPSRSEGTPQSMIQAMLCARPVIVTDVGGNTDWVAEPEAGFIAEAASVPSIGRALDRAWDARARWPEIGHAAHLAALARLDRHPERTLLDLLVGAATRGVPHPDAGERPAGAAPSTARPSTPIG